MKFVRFAREGSEGLAIKTGEIYRGILTSSPDYPGNLSQFVGLGREGLAALSSHLGRGQAFEADAIDYLPPFPRPPKIICVGLNYRDHTAESGFDQPEFPTFFGRFSSGLVGHMQPIIEPAGSATLDFEGELAVIIGKRGRHISRTQAHDYIAGYSVFNDGSVREYQFKSPQWMIGKNFDNTGAFGPHFVTADELPAGAKGLGIVTRLNGQVVQSSNTDLLVFNIASVVAHISEAMTLEPGDVIVSGTPAGVGHARSPKLYMKQGDQVEVEIEGVGLLRNDIVREERRLSSAA
ncbi:fumarylacetoacetate hydrolase family protein [Mesorhizobium sp. CGMCC 1.15528]|uniref:Fumarylacetoacetate hydrolase family protein n=2 Tax=Mesorhizobium zhangyense TaxID=1776730 RepID=A0A7C9RBR1_9HYPH|nr:fumarylacetoacetate hydrolase family protein [Mesorhizobium zhangyense]